MPWYIDAVAELDELHARHCASCNAFSGEDCKQCKIGHIVDFLENKYLGDEPTADVAEVKHGEWNIGEFNKIRQVVVVECSECYCVLELPMSSWGLVYHYCPNCGAKMDGKGDSNG